MMSEEEYRRLKVGDRVDIQEWAEECRRGGSVIPIGPGATVVRAWNSPERCVGVIIDLYPYGTDGDMHSLDATRLAAWPSPPPLDDPIALARWLLA